MAMRDYEVVSVPPGCTSYEVGEIIPLDTGEPPQRTYTIQNEGACSGTVVQLAE